MYKPEVSKIQNGLVEMLEKEACEYFVTLFLVKQTSSNKINNIMRKFSRKLRNALVGRYWGKRNLSFSLVPFIERTKNDYPHIHLGLGGDFKPHLNSGWIKTIISDIWTKVSKHTMAPTYHNPLDNEWFKKVENFSNLIRYMSKQDGCENVTDKLLLDGLILSKG